MVIIFGKIVQNISRRFRSYLIADKGGVNCMNISLSKWIPLVLGIILLAVGTLIGIDAMRATDWVKGVFALAGIIVGLVLISGKVITVSQ